jgi:regulation of enolase protein 1 (concanavalin A-like superfamily)
MSRQTSFWGPSLAAAAVLLALALQGLAASPPPAPWSVKEFGAPRPPGTADVDANQVWTLRGSGTDIWSQSDSFLFAYQPVRGNGSLTARFLQMDGGNREWARAGLMVRENDAADGAPNLNYAMTPAHGLVTTFRDQSNRGTNLGLGQVGPSRIPQRLYLRLQRVDQEVAGFYSEDGDIWTQAAFTAQTLPLGDTAFFGLSVTSHSHGELTTASFDQVGVQPGRVSVFDVIARAASRRVLLEWRPLPEAAGYNLYRAPAAASGNGASAPEQFVSLSPDRPVNEASYLDQGPGLTDGTPVRYLIEPLFRESGGSLVKGPRVVVQATPTTLPPDWFGCSIMEGASPGAAIFDANTGTVRLRGSGGGILGLQDEMHFLCHEVSGSTVQITTRMLTRPSSVTGRAGLMIRESLEPGARNVVLLQTGSGSATLHRTYRETRNGATSRATSIDTRLPANQPIWLRLTRRGSQILFEYAADGANYRQAMPPLTLNPPLAGTLYLGLASTATDRTQMSEAQFTLPEVRIF